MEPSMGTLPDYLYILDLSLKKHSVCSLWAMVFSSQNCYCELQTRERYEKVLEDVTSYTPRYMEEMEAIFEQSQEEERKRISFLKQAFLSIHRHLDVTNNERWTGWLGVRNVCVCVDGIILCWQTQLSFPVSVWRQCTVNSTKHWCPSVTRMISNGGRTITVPACPPTGQRLRCVTKFHSDTQKTAFGRYVFLHYELSYPKSLKHF